MNKKQRNVIYVLVTLLQSDNQVEELLDFYNNLQYVLYETGFPETQDRTAMPSRANIKENAVVALLSPPDDCMAIVLECRYKIATESSFKSKHIRVCKFSLEPLIYWVSF